MKNKFFLSIILAFCLILYLTAPVKSVDNNPPIVPFSSYFDNNFITSVLIQEATLSTFCEVDKTTNKCSENNKEIIFGTAVLKYDSSKINEMIQGKDNSSQQEIQSEPFSIFIIDNQTYISPIVGAYAPPDTGSYTSNENTVIKDPEYNSTCGSEDGIPIHVGGIVGFLGSVGEPCSQNEKWTIDGLVSPEGFSQKNQLVYGGVEPVQVYVVNLNLFPLEMVGGTLRQYNVSSVDYTEYRLLTTEKTINNLEIEK